jgi:hypothetical protein
VTIRRSCAHCGHDKSRAYWSDDRRERVIGRCLSCGANFHGTGVWLPSAWAMHSVRGLSMEIDPHAKCLHGHQPHAEARPAP